MAARLTRSCTIANVTTSARDLLVDHWAAHSAVLVRWIILELAFELCPKDNSQSKAHLARTSSLGECVSPRITFPWHTGILDPDKPRESWFTAGEHQYLRRNMSHAIDPGPIECD